MKSEETTFSVYGMTCANCAATIERQTKKLQGIRTVNANFALNNITVSYDPTATSIEAIRDAVRSAGYEPGAEDAESAVEDLARAQDRETRLLIVGLALTLPLFILSMGRDLGFLGRWAHSVWVDWVLAALATPVQFYVGLGFYRGAVTALRNMTGNMDLLIALGSSAAYFSSLAALILEADLHLYFETSAVIITLIRLGRFLESRAKRRAGDAIRQLAGLIPQTALVQRGNDVMEISPDQIELGDIAVVKPGSRIPVDGIVVEGASAVDESMLTGESIPIDKEPNSEAIGGTLNKEGLLRIRTTRIGQNTTLARIIRLVEGAQGSKAPIQRLADRWAAIFVPVVVTVAIVTLAGWLLWEPNGTARAVINAVAVLVIACPCALGLATPTAVVVGTGVGAQSGVLFKGGAILERTSAVDTVLLDKTGTLTQGELVVTDLLVSDRTASMDDETMLRYAASAEQGSEHPLATAIVEAAQQRGLSLHVPTEFRSVRGVGIEAEVQGVTVKVGRSMTFGGQDAEASEYRDIIATLQDQGKTTVIVTLNAEISGVIGISDTLRPETHLTVERFKHLKLDVGMVTGDNTPCASAMANDAGIDMVLAELLPGEKSNHVRALQEAGSIVAMVGDGVNDAPALVQADVGIAVGTGADVAVEAADITIVGDDLRGVARAFDVSRQTMKTIRQNLFWAFFYNVLFIPAAAFGFLHPMMAAFAMACSSLLVVANSLRLRRFRAPI